MEAKNLRVGSLVLYNDFGECVNEPTKIDLEDLIWQKKSPDTFEDYNTPIELTPKIMRVFCQEVGEEWILPIEARNKAIRFDMEGDLYYPVIVDIEEGQEVGVVCLEYLHEIQNLFFAIHGEELEIETETLKAAL